MSFGSVSDTQPWLPPADLAVSGFAWLVEPDFLMSADSGERLRAYQLVPPIPIRGVLRSGDGKAVPNALVRAYVLVDTGGGTTRPLQVAETVSGEDTRNTCSWSFSEISLHCFFSDLRDRELRVLVLIS